jgi:hypothetical protein
MSLSLAAHVLVTCYSDLYRQDFYNAGTKKGSSASSGLPHQRRESTAAGIRVVETNADSLDEAEALFLATKEESR